MHEFSIATELVAAVVGEAERHGARRVESLECQCGTMRQIVPAMLIDAFELAAADTLAEGAQLTVKTVPPTIRCRDCGAETQPTDWAVECPRCTSLNIAVEGGDELLLTSVTLEVDDER